MRGRGLNLSLRAAAEPESAAFAVRLRDVCGRAESVTATGALCLRRADGSLAVLPAGEVTLASAFAAPSGSALESKKPEPRG